MKLNLCTMCMIIDQDGKILVELRRKKDWPGLTFPGGKVEDYEDIESSCIREIKEETGLEVSNLINVGNIEWFIPDEDVRHLSILFKSKNYKGNIKSSEEGEVFFIDLKDIKNYPLSNDFDKILELMTKNL